MTEREKIYIFDTWIAEAGAIAISSHTHPDGDAVGSACALAEYLRKRGKTVSVVLPDPVPGNLLFALDEAVSSAIFSDLQTCRRLIGEADMLISIDYNRADRAAGLEEAITVSKARKVLIDHHLNPDSENYGLVFSTPQISSSCEMLYRVLMSMPDIDGDAGKLGLKAASLLMLGMTTDTNNFANSTYPSTFEMAGKLIAVGVDRQALLNGLYNSYRENRLRLMGTFLKDKLKITGYGLAYAIFTAEELLGAGIEEGETEGFVNLPLAIASVRMSIFIKEEGQTFRVSLRSRQGVSANRCAKLYFHGGGHENASGGRLDIPQDAASAVEAAGYVEKCCAEFFRNEELWRTQE